MKPLFALIISLSMSTTHANEVSSCPKGPERKSPSEYLKLLAVKKIKAAPQGFDSSKINPSSSGMSWYKIIEPNTLIKGPWTTKILIQGAEGTLIAADVTEHISGGVHLSWRKENLEIEYWSGRIMESHVVVDLKSAGIQSSYDLHHIEALACP